MSQSRDAGQYQTTSPRSSLSPSSASPSHTPPSSIPPSPRRLSGQLLPADSPDVYGLMPSIGMYFSLSLLSPLSQMCTPLLPCTDEVSNQAAPKQRDQYEIDVTELKIEYQIGQGAYGIVYKGSWRNTPVAVKQLRHDTLFDPLKLEEFKAEAKGLLSLYVYIYIYLSIFVSISLLPNTSTSPCATMTEIPLCSNGIPSPSHQCITIDWYLFL